MQILKRDGSYQDFDSEKIYSAIQKAYKEVFIFDDVADGKIVDITKKVVRDMFDLGINAVPIYEVQASVERWLLDSMPKVAESYIRYRLQQDLHRAFPNKNVSVNLHISVTE